MSISTRSATSKNESVERRNCVSLSRVYPTIHARSVCPRRCRSYPDIGIDEGQHELSHHGKSEERQATIATINRFHIDRFGYLLSRLKSIQEGAGTLLDNCMLVYGSGISDGDRHNHDDLPIILAGGGAGRIKTGRHIRYSNKTPLCNFYLWMLNEMGAKVERFGDSNGKLDKLG